MSQDLAPPADGPDGLHDGIGPVPTTGWGPLLPDQTPVVVEPEEAARLQVRRRAVRDLGRAIRAAARQSVISTVTLDELGEAQALIERAQAILQRQSRAPGEPAEVDDLMTGMRMYAPLSGEGSPVLEPVRFVQEGTGMLAHCELGPEYEGPPGHIHGGIISLLLDQALGHVVSAQGKPGLTKTLEVSYRAPVPLRTPLAVHGEVMAMGPRHVMAKGWISTQAESEVRLVTAVGHFRIIRPEQALSFLAG